MAAWAYECRSCSDGGVLWVSRERVDALPAEVRILRVKSGNAWRCALVDRSRAIALEATLLSEAVASDAGDCPGCAASIRPANAQPRALADTPLDTPVNASSAPARQLQAAAITLQGRRMLVVLAGMDLLRSPGEADMLIADLRPRFGGVEVVLMAQDDSDTPHYHGAAELMDLLADMPIDKMPWKSYPVGSAT